ncbi:hypothetical protein HY045_01485 [Candidatus Woesebacteria bacterium]|nr:hypothetical protein [Candidatus Woesebacteria bacterium]
MLETPHVVVGAAIAVKIGNPWLAIPLAFGSHFLLEKVPHWNPHLNTEKKKFGIPTKQSTLIVVGDVIVSLVLGGFITSKALPDTAMAMTILGSGFAAVLPDLIEAPYFFLNMKSKFITEKWIPFQKSLQNDTSPLPGLATQVVTVIAALLWIFN